jgi:hypothetical protein
MTPVTNTKRPVISSKMLSRLPVPKRPGKPENSESKWRRKRKPCHVNPEPQFCSQLSQEIIQCYVQNNDKKKCVIWEQWLAL